MAKTKQTARKSMGGFPRYPTYELQGAAPSRNTEPSIAENAGDADIKAEELPIAVVRQRDQVASRIIQDLVRMKFGRSASGCIDIRVTTLDGRAILDVSNCLAKLSEDREWAQERGIVGEMPLPEPLSWPTVEVARGLSTSYNTNPLGMDIDHVQWSVDDMAKAKQLLKEDATVYRDKIMGFYPKFAPTRRIAQTRSNVSMTSFAAQRLRVNFQQPHQAPPARAFAAPANQANLQHRDQPQSAETPTTTASTTTTTQSPNCQISVTQTTESGNANQSTQVKEASKRDTTAEMEELRNFKKANRRRFKAWKSKEADKQKARDKLAELEAEQKRMKEYLADLEAGSEEDDQDAADNEEGW
ncbi:hypothetical protein BDY17DRAFT_313469 [Neohortaea acidophila]|uniref:Uncharacterized protein n=1 Tax=Neohortaea acidophila TaxID=245834 RepID=A0A6A6PJ32_9PEZI|nr:uncharacterized protein BDY17DRAFT_313469 [Neohortaea acidophila]KAF2479721.1 hypothetical protein BDY17DRAFT_313469 [Neohortaea acidophila]